MASHVVSVSENKTSLYKYIFPPELEQPTLAIIGLVQPLGAIMPISEMQARWATRVFKGKTSCRIKNVLTSQSVLETIVFFLQRLRQAALTRLHDERYPVQRAEDGSKVTAWIYEN